MNEIEEKEKHSHEGHRQRLRERYQEFGIDQLEDHEVLELLLGYTILQKDTSKPAHALVDQFGGLRNALDADAEWLMEIPGIGPQSAFFLKLIPDITRRYYGDIARQSFSYFDAKAIEKMLISRFISHKSECIYVLLMDANYRQVRCCPLYEGSINSVEIHLGTLAEMIAQTNARYLILAHNHYNNVIPSLQDIIATREVRKAIKKQGVSMLDHYVICGSELCSMKRSGHLRKTE